MMVVIIFWFAIHAKLNDGKKIPNGICLNNYVSQIFVQSCVQSIFQL
jgi:hypothetical protein